MWRSHVLNIKNNFQEIWRETISGGQENYMLNNNIHLQYQKLYIYIVFFSRKNKYKDVDI